MLGAQAVWQDDASDCGAASGLLSSRRERRGGFMSGVIKPDVHTTFQSRFSNCFRNR